MTDIAIQNRDGVLLMDSREVAEMVEKPHNDLLKSIRQYCEYLTAGDFPLSDFFLKSEYQDSTGRTLPHFLITRKGCDMIANKLTGKKGVLFTAAYVTKFEEMERELAKPKLPTDFLSALKALVTSEEEKQVLVLQNEQQGKVIDELKPKALFADAVSASDTPMLIRELAKFLKQNGVDTGERRFFQWLRDNGYLIKRKGADYNTPTQRSMDLGLFKLKETSIVHNDGTVTVNRTPRVTGKGQLYFINMLVGAVDLEKLREQIKHA